MTDLYLHQKSVGTVFDLLGDKENDLTYSVGWALSQAPSFCQGLLDTLFPKTDVGAVVSVNLQTYGEDRGYTDIEIQAEHAHVIVEAKRGWNLPSEAQLRRYRPRFKGNVKHRAVVVVSECSLDFVNGRLPKKVDRVPVMFVSWKHLAEVAMHKRAGRSLAEKRLLLELDTYLRGLMSMQDQESNMVYLVVLSDESAFESGLKFTDIVFKKRRYFHPFGGNGWPTTPPNYLGFRYKGQLRSLHHVDGYQIVDDLPRYFPEFNSKVWHKKYSNTYILYTLGPAIKPPHVMRNGNIYGTARLRVALDLLFTSRTIEDAYKKTKQRNTRAK